MKPLRFLSHEDKRNLLTLCKKKQPVLYSRIEHRCVKSFTILEIPPLIFKKSLRTHHHHWHCNCN